MVEGPHMTQASGHSYTTCAICDEPLSPEQGYMQTVLLMTQQLV